MAIENPKPMHDFVITAIRPYQIEMCCKAEATDGLSDFGALIRLSACEFQLQVDPRFDFNEVVAYVAHTYKAELAEYCVYDERVRKNKVDRLFRAYKAAEDQPNDTSNLIDYYSPEGRRFTELMDEAGQIALRHGLMILVSRAKSNK